eukprot:SM000041S15433  [mRNA]  locus=s41:68104:70878:- [translate_table: standard]
MANVVSMVVIATLGLMFLCSGLLVNIIQLLSMLVLLPFSRKLYRKVNMVLLDAFWSQLVWLVEWWGRSEVRVYTDAGTFEMMGKEHALLICNHRSDIDWVVGWVLAKVGTAEERVSWRHSSPDEEISAIPAALEQQVIGWSMWFSEYMFLARDWTKDEALLKKGYDRFRNFPGSMWMALFVEGTRFTQEKLEAAQEYAASIGLPVPRNVLVPRTKGFVATVNGLRPFVPALYDITVAIPKESPLPTFGGLMNRRPTKFHVHVRRVLMRELPEKDDILSEWCKEAFREKDALLDDHQANNTFGEDKLCPSGRSSSALLITMAWAVLLLCSAGWGFFKIVSMHALSWTLLGWLAIVLLVVMAILQLLLFSTQSEHSTPAARLSRTPSRVHTHRD